MNGYTRMASERETSCLGSLLCSISLSKLLLQIRLALLLRLVPRRQRLRDKIWQGEDQAKKNFTRMGSCQSHAHMQTLH